MKKNKENERKIFSVGELKYLKDKKSVRKKERGSYKKRIIERLKTLKEREIISALKTLDEEERIEIISNLLNSLDFKKIKRISKEFQKKMIEEIEDMKKGDLINKKINEIIHKKFNSNIWLNINQTDSIYKKINSINKKKIIQEVEKIIMKPNFVIARKILRDKIEFIRKTPLRKKLFEKIKERKKMKVEEFILRESKESNKKRKFSQKRKEIMILFIEMGIIFPEKVTKEDFIKKCGECILKIKHKKNHYIEKTPRLDRPFDYKEDTKIIKFNPYYKHISFSQIISS